MLPQELFMYDMYDGMEKCKKTVHGNVKYATSLRGRKIFQFILELEKHYGTSYYLTHQRIAKQMTVVKNGIKQNKPNNELNAYFHYLWLAIVEDTNNENSYLKKVMG